MGFDEKILSRVLSSYDRRRQSRELDLTRRRGEVYQRVPRIADIDSELKTTAIQIITSSLRNSTNPAPALSAIKEHSRRLKEERSKLLKNNGFPTDHLEPKEDCFICGDSGFLPSGPCSCLISAYAEAQSKELSRLLPISNQNFDTFSLNLYSTDVDPKWGMSPRENMTTVLDTCREFSAYFGPASQNLFLCGSTGLGKTFLSSCIAGELTQKGVSVMYDTAINIFATYEREKFSKYPEVTEEAAEDINRFLRCDLLILDDLGTEMQSPFINTALYSLINNRLMQNKKMIINSNLTEDSDIPRRYSPQIVSRLKGEFLTLPFFGDDIRVMKNMY